jgi:branched-chain amino acid aminotransferase
MKWVCHNGTLVPALQPLFTAQNRSFRYGDGIFETIKVVQNRMLLSQLHFERLFTSLHLLGIQPGMGFTKEFLVAAVLNLCNENGCSALARVRLAVYRNEQNRADYVIEAIPLDAEVLQWHTNGWRLELYPQVRKSCDALANIKSANYLPYVLAGMYAQEKGADEALVLNAFNHIADGSKTNLFLIKEGELFTPALNQGCVNGVMRRWIIDNLKKNGFSVHQGEVKEEQLKTADEVFCTNAIQGIRWVQSFGAKQYSSSQTRRIYELLAGNILS